MNAGLLHGLHRLAAAAKWAAAKARAPHPASRAAIRHRTQQHQVAARVGVTSPVEPCDSCAADHIRGQLIRPSCAAVNCAKTCTAALHRTCTVANSHLKRYSHAHLQVEPLQYYIQKKELLIAICKAGLWCVDTHHHPTSRPAGPRCPCVCVEVQRTAARRCKLTHCARRRPERRCTFCPAQPVGTRGGPWQQSAGSAASRLTDQPCLDPRPWHGACGRSRVLTVAGCASTTLIGEQDLLTAKGAVCCPLSCRAGRQILYVTDHWLVRVIGTFTLLMLIDYSVLRRQIHAEITTSQ